MDGAPKRRASPYREEEEKSSCQAKKQGLRRKEGEETAHSLRPPGRGRLRPRGLRPHPFRRAGAGNPGKEFLHEDGAGPGIGDSRRRPAFSRGGDGFSRRLSGAGNSERRRPAQGLSGRKAPPLPGPLPSFPQPYAPSFRGGILRRPEAFPCRNGDFSARVRRTRLMKSGPGEGRPGGGVLCHRPFRQRPLSPEEALIRLRAGAQSPGTGVRKSVGRESFLLENAAFVTEIAEW